jgi:hypothetical protein
MSAPLVGLGVGFLASLRFKAIVLAPIALAAILLLLASAGLNWSNAERMLLTAVAIEFGYVIGLIATELAAHLDWHQISRWRRHTRS